MSNGIFVAPEIMDEQGRRTAELAVQLEGQIDQLKNNKSALLDIWKGGAATSFGESVDSQILNLNKFKELINELGEKISDGANTFNDTEEENTSAGRNLFED